MRRTSASEIEKILKEQSRLEKLSHIRFADTLIYLMLCAPRSQEDVSMLVKLAKLNANELEPTTQCLEFSEHFGHKNNDMKLLEVDSKLLSLLQEGDVLTVRGELDESSVICTKDKTFEVRGAETSNSMLVVPDLIFPEGLSRDSNSLQIKQVHSIHYKYMELILYKPRLWKLSRLMEARTYNGNSSSMNPRGYHLEELLNLVQCSEIELQEALRKIKAYEIEGCWQMLEFDYHFRLLSSILNVLDSNSWSVFRVNKVLCLETLNDVEPQHLLKQCFDYFFTSTDVPDNKGNSLFEIKSEEVNRFFAEVLLKHSRKFNLNDFLNIWQQSVPEGVTTHLSQLRGVALTETTQSPPVIWFFPSSDVPPDVAQAFNLLFETKEKWTAEELSPYLEQFVSEKTQISSLLNKYGRASLFNGVKYYTMKHSR